MKIMNEEEEYEDDDDEVRRTEFLSDLYCWLFRTIKWRLFLLITDRKSVV